MLSRMIGNVAKKVPLTQQQDRNAVNRDAFFTYYDLGLECRAPCICVSERRARVKSVSTGEDRLYPFENSEYCNLDCVQDFHVKNIRLIAG